MNEELSEGLMNEELLLQILQIELLQMQPRKGYE